MADDPGKTLTEAERAAAVLAHFQAGGCYFPTQPAVAAPASEFRVLSQTATPE